MAARRRFRPGRTNDLIAVAIGTAVWLAFLLRLHTWLIGVPVLPGAGRLTLAIPERL